MGGKTELACESIGRIMKEVLEELNCWIEVEIDEEEKEAMADTIGVLKQGEHDSDFDDDEYVASQEDEDEDDEEEEDDDDLLRVASVLHVTQSTAFSDPKFKEPYPHPPIYIGYSHDPAWRFGSHSKRIHLGY